MPAIKPLTRGKSQREKVEVESFCGGRKVRRPSWDCFRTRQADQRVRGMTKKRRPDLPLLKANFPLLELPVGEGVGKEKGPSVKRKV